MSDTAPLNAHCLVNDCMETKEEYSGEEDSIHYLNLDRKKTIKDTIITIIIIALFTISFLIHTYFKPSYLFLHKLKYLRYITDFINPFVGYGIWISTTFAIIHSVLISRSHYIIFHIVLVISVSIVSGAIIAFNQFYHVSVSIFSESVITYFTVYIFTTTPISLFIRFIFVISSRGGRS